jgi:hypothetical protein
MDDEDLSDAAVLARRQQIRKDWLLTTHRLAADLMRLAYVIEAKDFTRISTMKLDELFEQLPGNSRGTNNLIDELCVHVGHTPFGFARYGGKLQRATLLELPAVVEALMTDTVEQP